ncbi:MFS transporter, partial [Psychrobacter proteolyticus]
VEQFGWWTLFAITLPLSAAVMAIVWWLIPDIRSHDKISPFDTIGFVSLLIWLLSMMVWLSTLKIDFTGGLF